MRVDTLRGEMDYIGNDGEKHVFLYWFWDRDIYISPEEIASKAKNGRKNKIILRKMPPLKMKSVTLLRVKT